MIYNLTSKDSEKKIKQIEKKIQKGLWMVRYYADWCGHCKLMESDWEKLEKNNKKGNIVSLESEVMNKMNLNLENFEGYPTIIIQNNNKKIQDFDQERTFKNFQQFYNSFMKKKNSKKNKIITKRNKKISIKKKLI